MSTVSASRRTHAIPCGRGAMSRSTKLFSRAGGCQLFPSTRLAAGALQVRFREHRQGLGCTCMSHALLLLFPFSLALAVRCA
jgi:hypothetical protein